MILFLQFLTKLWKYFEALFYTSVIAFIITAFYTMYHFNVITPVGILTNLVAVPFFSFLIMPLCIVILILLPFGGLVYPFLNLLDYLFVKLDFIAQFFKGFNLTYHVQQMPSYSIFIFSFAFYFFIVFKNKWIKAICGILILFSFFTPFLSKIPTVMIAENGQLVAVKKEDGRLQFFGKISLNKFVANQWIAMYGQDDIQKSEKNYCARQKQCCYDMTDKRICVLRDFKDIYKNIKMYCEDNKNIIVSNYEIKYENCEAKLIDKKRLQKSGNLFLY